MDIVKKDLDVAMEFLKRRNANWDDHGERLAKLLRHCDGIEISLLNGNLYTKEQMELLKVKKDQRLYVPLDKKYAQKEEVKIIQGKERLALLKLIQAELKGGVSLRGEREHRPRFGITCYAGPYRLFQTSIAWNEDNYWIQFPDQEVFDEGAQHFTLKDEKLKKLLGSYFADAQKPHKVVELPSQKLSKLAFKDGFSLDNAHPKTAVAVVFALLPKEELRKTRYGVESRFIGDPKGELFVGEDKAKTLSFDVAAGTSGKELLDRVLKEANWHMEETEDRLVVYMYPKPKN